MKRTRLTAQINSDMDRNGAVILALAHNRPIEPKEAQKEAPLRIRRRPPLTPCRSLWPGEKSALRARFVKSAYGRGDNSGLRARIRARGFLPERVSAGRAKAREPITPNFRQPSAGIPTFGPVTPLFRQRMRVGDSPNTRTFCHPEWNAEGAESKAPREAANRNGASPLSS